jgi:pimeloyl-ACP methyl ester carboxylesterase
MTPQIKNVVLAHGAFADGSGWALVARILKNNGYKVSVPQPPETSYADDDQKYTKAAIDAMGSPVVLVGHSYGGSIITAASNHPNVAALVYFAAFALDEGESCASIEQALPQASKAFKPDSNGDWWIDEAQFAADFAADIPREAEFMAISQVPISTDCFTHQVRKLQSGDAVAAKCSPVSLRSAVEVRRRRLSSRPRRSASAAPRKARCGRRRSVRAPRR